MTSAISWKPDLTLVCVEEEIRALDTNQDQSRNSLYARALVVGKEVKKDGWSEVQAELSHVKVGEKSVPTSMQVTLTEEMRTNLEIIAERMRADLGLARLKTTYMFKLILLNYRDSLRQKAMAAAIGKRGGPGAELSGPETVAALTELLLLNRREDREVLEQIKGILSDWRNTL